MQVIIEWPHDEGCTYAWDCFAYYGMYLWSSYSVTHMSILCAVYVTHIHTLLSVPCISVAVGSS